ncbi:response regulator [Noviherbaspirillum saxi]|nr:response regulator [Noviherbaspirillum saxi]
MLAVLATTCAALLVSALAMLTLDVRNYQTAWANDLMAQSDILAKVSLPALEFNDLKVARENLEQMKARPRIFAAAIYLPDGSVFASYSKNAQRAAEFPKFPAASGYTTDLGRVSAFSTIVRNGEIVGAVYLGADYPLAQQVKRYLTVLVLVMAVSLFIALLVSTRLQAAITKPILAVTEAANQVISRRDFSMRVKKSTDDEIGILVDAFNSMLTEVGERAKVIEESNVALQREMKERRDAEEALKQLNNTLEDRIRERTAELERAHAQLRQSQKLEAVGQLTGGVAHDFNNVLQVITGNLQLLQMTLAGNPDAQKRLETATFAADRGAKLSSQLLAFARRQPLQPVASNLAGVLRGMDDLLRRALGESVQIETVVAGGLWTTLVDPNQLENVILNLAINARDAMKGDGKLTLELGNAMLDDHYVLSEPDVVPGQYVLLAISDTGTGMPPEVIARAFEPFFTTKREGEGTGLGLSMAYGFVKQSNGHIRLYSEVGSGTTIRIYLPRSMQPEVEVNNSRGGQVAGGTETILVVEDDTIVQATVVDMLSQLGYRVLKASDGQSALHILQSGIPIDLLFTDVVMPGPVRSPDLARQAKQIFPEIEVLFTSGYTQNAIVHGGRLDPGVELISKPYRREDLARKIRQVLSRKQPAAAPMPLTSAPGPVTNSASAAPAPLHILIVEDHDDARLMLSELLTILGHQVESVSSAEEALKILATTSFDVLLTDLMLPGMSGLDLARKLVRDGVDIEIVFSTGYGSLATDNIDIKAALLPKPFNLAALQKVLEEIHPPRTSTA